MVIFPFLSTMTEKSVAEEQDSPLVSYMYSGTARAWGAKWSPGARVRILDTVRG